MQATSQNTFQSHGKLLLDFILVLGRAVEFVVCNGTLYRNLCFIKHIILKLLMKFEA
jgi:hypothetical protein